MNEVILGGNLGSDPQLNYTQSGTAICKLTVATNKKWKDKDGNKKTDTQWHRVTVFGKRAETVSKFLEKGSFCLVTGEIRYSTFDKEDGTKQYMAEIVADDVEFVGVKNSGGQQQQNNPPPQNSYQQQQPQQNSYQAPQDDDDIPF